jgi:hypothetical protein
MHKKGLCANKWTKIDPNQGLRQYFFQEHEEHCLKIQKKM